MRLNIENCAKNGEPGHKEWALEELVRNLKEVRDRSNAGDMQAAVTEFFEVFRFSDNQTDPSPIRALAAHTAPAPTEPVHWRALLDPEQRPHKLQTHHHVVGFTSLKACEAFVDGELDMNGWRYTIEPLYATPPSAVEAAQPEAVARPDPRKAFFVLGDEGGGMATFYFQSATEGKEWFDSVLAAAPTTEATSSSDAERLLKALQTLVGLEVFANHDVRLSVEEVDALEEAQAAIDAAIATKDQP